MIESTDQHSQDYGTIKNLFRPGHVDYTYEQKCSLRDYHDDNRSSAREIAMCVATGAITKKYLTTEFSIVTRGCLTRMGDIPLTIKDWDQVE